MLIILILTVSLLGGCSQNDGSDNGENFPVINSTPQLTVDTTFKSFVQSIPYLDADFYLNNGEDFKHVNLKNKFIPEGAALIGKLPSIDQYEFIVYSYPADIRLPILEVYNSKGKKVNERALFKYGYCTVGDLGPLTKHEVSLSPDKTKFYLTTTCPISFSGFYYDSIVLNDLIHR